LAGRQFLLKKFLFSEIIMRTFISLIDVLATIEASVTIAAHRYGIPCLDAFDEAEIFRHRPT